MNHMILSHKQAVALIKSVGHEVTVLLQGENGVGKTSIQHDLRQDPDFLGHNVLDPIDCTQLSDGSVWMPDIDRENGVSRELPNERFGISTKHHAGIPGSRPTVICLDEILKCPQYIKNVLAPVIHERRLGNLHLPRGSIVWGATNLAVEGLGDLIQPHLRSRLMKVTLRKPTQQEWRTEFAEPRRLHHTVIAFTEMFPQLFDSFMDYEPGGKFSGKPMSKDNPRIFNPREQQDGFASPRSLHSMSKIMHNAAGLDDTTLFAAIAGTAGTPTAADFMAVVKLDRDIPSFPRVIADPEGTPIVDNPTAQIVQVQQFIHFTTDRNDAAQLLKYVKRMRAEMQTLFVNQIATSTRCVTFATVDGFREMMNDNRLFLRTK
jgi:hypothetical protein